MAVEMVVAAVAAVAVEMVVAAVAALAVVAVEVVVAAVAVEAVEKEEQLVRAGTVVAVALVQHCSGCLQEYGKRLYTLSC